MIVSLSFCYYCSNNMYYYHYLSRRTRWSLLHDRRSMLGRQFTVEMRARPQVQTPSIEHVACNSSSAGVNLGNCEMLYSVIEREHGRKLRHGHQENFDHADDVLAPALTPDARAVIAVPLCEGRMRSVRYTSFVSSTRRRVSGGRSPPGSRPVARW